MTNYIYKNYERKNWSNFKVLLFILLMPKQTYNAYPSKKEKWDSHNGVHALAPRNQADSYYQNAKYKNI